MRINLLGTAITACLLISGCSALNNTTVSDEKLKERAAFALGVQPSQINISNRQNEGVRINFTATVGKRSSQCYVTNAVGVIGAMTSDAICSGSAGSQANKSPNGQCNALLKAAGRC
ncbi:MAG: hypothetical protein Q4C79_09210 [Neisseria sp.]|uniref:hypothetical protein n=1 Tax=Neisseria sp. TaxID=192066 RepID=UPI0026DA81A0|nr:hypothetical protein [Neisseria sp.]MDO4249115.1 hypothetical protein [Neisseria sp.]